MDKAKAHQIVDEVAERYTFDTRSVKRKSSVKDICVYQNECGYKCAVGYYLKDEVFDIRPAGSFNCLVDQANLYLYNEAPDEGKLTPVIDEYLFKSEVRGLPEEFWGRLQGLHDRSVNWDSDGLSPAGKQAMDLMKNWIDRQ